MRRFSRGILALILVLTFLLGTGALMAAASSGTASVQVNGRIGTPGSGGNEVLGPGGSGPGTVTPDEGGPGPGGPGSGDSSGENGTAGPGGESAGQGPRSGFPKTGDSSNVQFYIFLGLFALAVLSFLLARRGDAKNSNRQES